MLDFFFFSSRRRHTRWPRDWSSDVCSSDLCRKEAPDLQEISQDYGEQGVSFIGINVRDEAGPALAFEENYGITYPSLPDLDAEIMYALRGQVAPNAVPTTLLIDRAGRVAARVSGAIDPSTLRSMIDRVLAE